MRSIDVRDVSSLAKELSIKANVELREDVLVALGGARDRERSPQARSFLEAFIENAGVAKDKQLPLCQDTGFTSVYVEIGRDVILTGGNLRASVEDGVRAAYRDSGFRKSIVGDPVLDRSNTGDNGPPLVFFDLIEGDRMGVTVMPKGAGCDNQSRLAMLSPTAGPEEVMNFVVETVERSNGRACPPLVVGVGLGGSFDYAPTLAKKALLEPVGDSSRGPYGVFERELRGRIDNLGLGAMGAGGSVTALGVRVQAAPCHMASLPVAVDLSCHSLRSAGGTL